MKRRDADVAGEDEREKLGTVRRTCFPNWRPTEAARYLSVPTSNLPKVVPHLQCPA
jgi:hypothetical protein